MATILTPSEHRTALERRAEERQERMRQNRIKASQYIRSGDELCSKQNYIQASYFYADAVRLWNTNTEAYIKLAETHVKAKQYEQAAFIATRALTMDPKLADARYHRGVARYEQGLLRAAKMDFESVVGHCPAHARASEALETVVVRLSSPSSPTSNGGKKKKKSKMVDEEVGLDFEFPGYGEVALDVAELSESEECARVGNRVPCRYYNRMEGGCRRGAECLYMHAPDERSVRDRLGRNVCVYLLLGECRFGDRCVYAHEREWLPEKGWWTDGAQVERMKRLVALEERNARERREIERHLQQGKPSRHVRKARDRLRAPLPLPLPEEEEDVDVMGELGFGAGEMEELLCQGVKPWDDDAWGVLHALSYY